MIGRIHENMIGIVPDATKIRVEDHETRTNTNSMMLDRISLWLDKANIEYKILKEDEIPDDFIWGWTLLEDHGVDHTAVIISHLNSEDLLTAIDQLVFVSDSDI